MTFWAKLLVVVIFILSLIFASMSAVLFGKREDYRAQLKTMSDKYDHEKADWTSKNAALSAQILQVQNEEGTMRSNLDAAQLSVNTLTDAMNRKDNDLRAKDNEILQVTNVDTVQAAALKSFSAQVDTLLADTNSLKTENNTLTAKLTDEQSRSNKLEKENADLDASLKTATAELHKANDTLALNDEIFAELSRRNVAWRELITQWKTLPEIKTTVLKVDPEGNFVLLDAGQNQGVKKNYEFTIFRDGLFVAKVNVFDVQDKMCAARITVPKLAIQRGDNAWTRLAND